MNIHALAALIVGMTGVPAITAGAESLKLADYFHPVKAGANWIYHGQDWDGNPADMRVFLAETSHDLDLYTGASSTRSYSVSALRFECESGDLDGGAFIQNQKYDEWSEYYGAKPVIRYGEDDGNSSIRVDGGLVFPAKVTVGKSYSTSGDVYVKGKFKGEVKYEIKVMDKNPVTVPAGKFTDCVHLRLSVIEGVAASSRQDEWWVRGLGMVKLAGISGDGAGRLWLLKSTTVMEPEISVQQPAGSELTDGRSKTGFGTCSVGTVGVSRVFTIRNVGLKKLSLGTVSLNGSNAADFRITAAPAASSLAPGQSTTLKVVFKPKAAGKRSASLDVPSNDADENPFTVTLTGTGA